MAKYITEGIVRDAIIESGELTFSIAPTPPYSFEEKIGSTTKKNILFVVEPEAVDTLKLTLKVDGGNLSVDKQKVGKNETIKVSGITITNKSGTAILLEGASESKKRDAKVFPDTTKFTFSPGETAPMALGAFFVLMNNRTKAVFECKDSALSGKSPIAITGIEIKN